MANSEIPFEFNPLDVFEGLKKQVEELEKIEKEVPDLDDESKRQALLARLSEVEEEIREIKETAGASFKADPTRSLDWAKITARVIIPLGKIRRLRNSINAMDIKDTTAGVKKVESEIETGRLRNVKLLYAEYKKYNPKLPEFEEITPATSKVFFRELHVAIMNFYGKLIDEMTASGGGGIPDVGGEIKLWDGEFKHVSVDAEFAQNFQYFFHNFPYKKICEKLEPGTVDYMKYAEKIEELYKFRLLAISNTQNLAYQFRTETESPQARENTTFYIENVKKRVNEGGYAAWDLEPFHKRKFADPIMQEIFGEEDKSWMIAEHVNYFLGYIDRSIRDGLNPFPIIYNASKLGQIKAEAIANMPDSAHPLKDEGMDDSSMVDVAWSISLWTLQHTFKIFGYGPDGLYAKAERIFNIRDSLHHDGGYGVKILSGEAESGDRIIPTIATQVERAAFDRDSFIHVLVDLPPEAYEEISMRVYEQMDIEDEDGLKKEFIEMMKKRDSKQKKTIKDYEHMEIEEYEKFKKEFLDQMNVEDYKEFKRKFGELINTEDYKEFRKKRKYAKAARHLKIRSYLPDETGKSPTGEKYRQDVEERYKIIRIKPKWTSYGKKGEDEKDLGQPIAIPRGYFDFAEKMGYPTKIALSMSQIRQAAIDGSRVDWDSMTLKHQGFYTDAMDQLSKIYLDFHDPRKESGFTDIMDSVFDSKIMAKIIRIPGWERIVQSLPKGLELRGALGSQIYRKYGNKLEGMIDPPELTIDELATRADSEAGVVGMGFTAVVQYIAKYAVGKMRECGPRYPTSTPGKTIGMPIMELWTEVYRFPLKMSVNELLKEINKKLPKSKRKGALRERIQTPIHPGVRMAVDAMNKGYAAADVEKENLGDEMKARKGQSERTLIVSSFIIALGAYLDRYSFRTNEEIEVKPTFDVERDYERVKTVSGDKPLDPAHRILLKAFVKKMLEHFASENFASVDYPPLITYNLDDVDEMFASRGLNNSPQSFIVDRHWYKHQFPSLKEKNEKKD